MDAKWYLIVVLIFLIANNVNYLSMCLSVLICTLLLPNYFLCLLYHIYLLCSFYLSILLTEPYLSFLSYIF